MENILEERQKTHGEFEDNARISQTLKANLQAGFDGRATTPVQREALDMICLKLSRICSNPNVADHWDDIAGYATLAARELRP